MIKESRQVLRTTGFTLIEVLLVIVVVGLMVAAVQFSFESNKPETQLQQESVRFAGIFDLAAQYGLLNNVELGLVIQENSYQFVGYDGTQWVELPNADGFSAYQLPEKMKITVSFDDLAPDENALIDRELFEPDDDDFTLDEQEDKPIIPQVYILSGGDITPFTLTFAYHHSVQFEQEITYQVIGQYTTPLEVKGPIIDGEYRNES
ncbi:type II secretion system minor pseudopilin GspH [Thalassotalea ganghwensis]